MAKRKPQINFQVAEPMKHLYDEAKLAGHWVTRFCAAGFLLMVEDAQARARAMARLRDWELEYVDAGPERIRAFVEGARDAMQRGARGSRPGPAARRSKRKKGR